MQQWAKLGAYSLILWWALIGGLLMTYLYSVAGLAYLHEDFLATGKVPTGVEVPLQMATIASAVLGPTAGWLMLLFIMVTLYDAQFPLYDTLHRPNLDRRDRGEREDRREVIPLLVLRGGDVASCCRVLPGHCRRSRSSSGSRARVIGLIVCARSGRSRSCASTTRACTRSSGSAR